MRSAFELRVYLTELSSLSRRTLSEFSAINHDTDGVQEQV